jgi:hypothetical protein
LNHAAPPRAAAAVAPNVALRRSPTLFRTFKDAQGLKGLADCKVRSSTTGRSTPTLIGLSCASNLFVPASAGPLFPSSARSLACGVRHDE